jgi:hypothetical protein
MSSTVPWWFLRQSRLSAPPIVPPFEITSISPTSGNQVPLTLDIYGDGFTATCRGFMDSTSDAQTILIDATHLESLFDVLGPAGPYAVTVHDGSSVTNAVVFTVT